MTREPGSEHVGHQDHLMLSAYRTRGRGLEAELSRRPDQLGVSVTDLITPQPAPVVLVDEMTSRQTMVHRGGRTVTPQRGRREHHVGQATQARGSERQVRHRAPRTGHTDVVSTMVPSLWYGAGVPGEADLRLCGDVSAKRVLELGVDAEASNAVALAGAGAKAIVSDPDPERIALVRRRAEAAEVHVECHVGAPADLGFATSGSIDVVISSHRLGEVEDLARLFRQVHRVLRAEGPFVIAIPHPAWVMLDEDRRGVERPYGEGAFAIGSLLTTLARADLRVDTIHELRARREDLVPSTLVVRARKLGV